MSKDQKRKNFSVIRENGRYYVQCDETLEKMTGALSSKVSAQKLLKECVSTASFLSLCTSWTKQDIERKVKAFKGRLRPWKKPWTIEEARLVASLYSTRGELYNKNQKLYAAAYRKGWLNEICAHMKESRKKNKFTYGVLNPAAALCKLFNYKTHYEFTRENQSAYDILRRYGVDTLELFENKDSAEHLKLVIQQIGEVNASKFTETL